MRRLALLALAAASLSLVQLHVLNLAAARATFELPILAVLLATPFLKPVERVVVCFGAALPLDVQSVFPFGTFSLVFALTMLIASFLSLRLPIREHRALLLGLVGVGTLTTYLGLLLISSAAHWLRLGPWAAAAPFGLLLLTGVTIIARTLFLAALVLGAMSFGRLMHRRRYASH